MAAEVRPSISTDCEELYCSMTMEEQTELSDKWGVKTMEGLKLAFLNSHLCWTVSIDDEIAGMFGCVDAETACGKRFGNPWMVTSGKIEKVKLRFIRQSRKYVAMMFDSHDLLICNASKDNELLVNWIRWLGFEIKDIGKGFIEGRLEKCACRWLSQ